MGGGEINVFTRSRTNLKDKLLVVFPMPFSFCDVVKVKLY